MSDENIMAWQETEETSRALKWRVFLRLQRHCLDLHYARNLVAFRRSEADRSGQSRPLLAEREREFFTDSILVRIHFIIVMISWTGLAPREFEV